MERWQRLSPIIRQREQQVVLWRQSSTHHPLAVLVVVGLHFSFTVARDYSSAVEVLQLCSLHIRQKCQGGGPPFVDFLLDQQLHSDDDSNKNLKLTPKMRRKAAEDYLSLIGDYGLVSKNTSSWVVEKSTHPWREGACLLRPGDMSWKTVGHRSIKGSHHCMMQIDWKGQGVWEVFDSTLDMRGMESLFVMLPTSRL